jgi:hypothetical protein
VKSKFAVAVLVAASCTAPATSGTRSAVAINRQVASTPQAAVTMFMGAVEKRDTGEMGAVWGTSRGLARDVFTPTEFQQRAYLTMCYLSHDSYVITSEQADTAQGRMVAIRLMRGGNAHSTTIGTVPAGQGRWRVSYVDMRSLKLECVK